MNKPMPVDNVKTKVSLNAATGLLEVYCAETGKLLAVQATPNEEFYAKRRDKLVERVLPNGEVVLVEKTIAPEALNNFKFAEYSSYVVDMICEKITGGMGITKICALPGFPNYSEFCRWKRLYPEIEAQLNQARADRAEQMRDEIYEKMVNVDEDNIDSTKVKIEALKYLAGTDNKQRYGNDKTVVQAAAPVQIIISTGIVREHQPKIIEERKDNGTDQNKADPDPTT